MSTTKLVIFTDLDGTLLDYHTYACERVRKTLDQVRAHDIPVIFCSAKTRAEQEVYRDKLKIDDPFIVENGSAVFIPRGYFSIEYDYDRQIDQYDVIELGKPFSHIGNILLQASLELGIVLKRYGNMTVQEVAKITGLKEDEALRAKAREYEETIVTKLKPEMRNRLQQDIRKHGLALTDGARFCGVGYINSNKGRTVEILADLFRRQFGSVTTVGLGDSHNDKSMLAAVDRPYLVQGPEKRWEEMDVPGLNRINGVGPSGWSKAIEELLRSSPTANVIPKED